MSIAPPPSIAITLAINPPIFKRGDHDVEMSVTAVSDASYPITIFTWPNVLTRGLRSCVGISLGSTATLRRRWR
jgi:hypothetical protein